MKQYLNDLKNITKKLEDNSSELSRIYKNLRDAVYKTIGYIDNKNVKHERIVTNEWLQVHERIDQIECNLSDENMTIINMSCDKNSSIEEHKHYDLDETIYVLSGSISATIENTCKDKVVNAGDTIYIPNNTFHSFNIDEGAQLTVTYTRSKN